MDRSGLDRTDNFQNFCGLGLDRIQFCLIRTWTEKFHSPLRQFSSKEEQHTFRTTPQEHW